MDIQAVVPVHNYLTGTVRVVNDLHRILPGITDSYRVLVVNDHSDRIYAPVFRDLGRLPRTEVVTTPDDSGLRFAYREAASRGADVILACETDAEISETALAAMVAGWREMPAAMKASVTAFYRDARGRLVYPANKNWPVLGHRNCREILGSFELAGSTTRVALAHAVPFLVSLWNPECLLKIRPDHPRFMRLDGTLGLELTNQGWLHYRLMDVHHGHADGGKKSGARKNKSNAVDLQTAREALSKVDVP